MTVQGKDTPGSTGNEFNMLAFVFKQLLSQVQTATLVKVIACSNTGTVAPVGTVTVQPMVNQVSGNGQPTPHGYLYEVPYFRLQAGTNGIILDPKPGDIGLCVFCSRDISAVKATKKPANPSSPQTQFDWADGLYVGGFLNVTPANYIQFASTGQINIVSAIEAVLQAPTVNLNGSSGINLAGPTNINGATVDVTGAAVFPSTLAAASVAATGDVTSDAGINSLNAIALDVSSISGQVTNISNAPVALEAASASFPHGYVLTAGSNVTLTPAAGSPNTLTIAATGSSPPVPGTIKDLIFWLRADIILASNGNGQQILQNSCPWLLAWSPLVNAAGNLGATVSATQLNSLNVLAFPGSSVGRYQFPANAVVSTQTGLQLHKVTVFVVANITSYATSPTFISGTSGALAFRMESTGKLGLLKDFVAGIGTSTSAITSSTWFQGNATYDDSSGAFAFRSAQAANGSGTNVQAISTNTDAVAFDQGAGTGDIPGSIAELIVYNRVLTLTEIQSVEAYLHTKWGV